MSLVATGGNDTTRKPGAMAPVPADSTLGLGTRWRSALVDLARRPGFVAVMLAVGTLVAYAVLQVALGPTARGAGVRHAPPPAPADAQRCWTNDTSGTVFLAPWFAPLAPTNGLRSDCSMPADASAAAAVGAASPPYKRASAARQSTTAVGSGSTSASDAGSPQPSPADRARAAVPRDEAGSTQASSDSQRRWSDALRPTGARVPRPNPTIARPHLRDPGRLARPWPTGPPVIDVGGQHHDEGGTQGGNNGGDG